VKFKTDIQVSRESFGIDHLSRVLLLGSCFATNVGQRLLSHRFPVLVNPFGVLFNPVSIKNAISYMVADKSFDTRYLVQSDGLWHSFMHHGSFSAADKQQCLANIEASSLEARRFLHSASHVVITLGTAQVWRHVGLDEIVSNCHKVPSREFNHYMLSVNDVVECVGGIVSLLRSVNHEMKIVFSVSPVRYLSKGMHANQLSKATLLLALDQVVRSFPGIVYFPSYEIVMDDLRDYRFYEEDLVHPSKLAVDYIWDVFAQTFFNDETLAINARVARLERALHHRPMHLDSLSYGTFMEWVKTEEAALQGLLMSKK
jgi:hypothetical protein